MPVRHRGVRGNAEDGNLSGRPVPASNRAAADPIHVDVALRVEVRAEQRTFAGRTPHHVVGIDIDLLHPLLGLRIELQQPRRRPAICRNPDHARAVNQDFVYPVCREVGKLEILLRAGPWIQLHQPAAVLHHPHIALGIELHRDADATSPWAAALD